MRDLPVPITCLITDGKTRRGHFEKAREDILGLAAAAARAGITIFHVREKELTARELLDLVRDVVAARATSRMLITVSDRFDIALAADADGVHLSSNGLPVEVVRRYFPDDLLIGSSTHSVPEITNARSSGADYVYFGPIFDTPDKGLAVGPGRLGEACREVADLPIIGLGGINLSNYKEVLRSGAAGVAAIRMFQTPDSVVAAGNAVRRYGHE